MTTSFWLAAAVYLVPTFPLGCFWHLKVFRAEYDRLGVYRDEVIVPLGFSTMLVQAILFAWVYTRFFDVAREQWLSSAVQFGLFFGVLAWSLAVVPAGAKYRMNAVPRFLALETGFTVVHFLIVSPLIALAWSMGPA